MRCRMSSRSTRRFGPGAAVLIVLLSAGSATADIHQQLLDLARRQETQRRARFAAVRTPAELDALQESLRETFLQLIGGLPKADGAPPFKITAKIDADDYTIDKLVYESMPGYFVS